VPAPGDLRHLPGIQHLERLAETVQVFGVAFVVLGRLGACGAVYLAGSVEEICIDPVIVDGIAGKGDGLAVERGHCLIVTRSRIVFRVEFVWQIDHEAGIPPGGAFGNSAGVQDDNIQGWFDLGETPRCREPGKAGPDDNDIGRRGLLERLRGRLVRQYTVPGRRSLEVRQRFGGPDRRHSTASSSSSERSSQIVLICVY